MAARELAIRATTLGNKDHKSRNAMPLEQDSPIPEPPLYIADIPEAVEVYYEIAKYLKRYKNFGDADYMMIASAAWWAHCYVEATKEVKVSGMIQTFETGAQNVSAQFTVMEKASKQMMVHFKQLGLTPQAREGIRSFLDRIPDSDGDGDAFAEVM